MTKTVNLAAGIAAVDQRAGAPVKSVPRSGDSGRLRTVLSKVSVALVLSAPYAAAMAKAIGPGLL